MKVKILDLQLSTLPTEGRPDRPPIIREYTSSTARGKLSLFLNDCPSVIPADIQQWDALVVSILPSRIFTVPYQEHLVVAIDIRPPNATDFILSHGCRDCEADNTPKWNLLPWIQIECCNEAVELILCWPPVSLVALSDEAESHQCDAGEANALRRSKDPVNGCSVAQDCLDVSEINSQGDRTGALSSAFLSELRSRSSSESLNCPSLRSRKVRLALLERPKRLPTSWRSAR